MPVNDTRIAVNLKDNASAGLRTLTANYRGFSNTIRNSGAALAQFNRQMNSVSMGGFASNADKAANSLSNMNKTVERLVYSASRYFVIYKAIASVGNVWDQLVGGSYEYAKSLETNQIGIAGILKSMITLNGEQIKWNDAMAISGKAMKSLQSEALRTAATSKELIETFRALLGPGLSSGMSIDQIVKLSTVGTNAVRSLGLPTNQYVQELRSIITEGIRPASSTLATSLGITNKDIKEAKASAEGLFNFLMKRMQGFSDAVKYTSGTVEGRIARIQEGLQVAGAKGAEALYQSWSNVLEKIANYLIPIPEKLGDKWEINPEFVKSIEKIAQTVGKIADGLADAGSAISPFASAVGGGAFTALGQMADKLKYIFGLFAARKIAPFVTDIGNIALSSREAYEAQTSLGRAIQGVSDKLRGRTVELQRLAVAQAEYNALVNTFFDNLNFVNTMQGMVNSNANSITNLAAKWQRMGMSAKEAGKVQDAVLQKIKSGNEQIAQTMIKNADAKASEIEVTKQYESAVKKAYDTELQAIRQVIREQNNKKLSDKEKVTKFLGKDVDKNVYKWQIDSTNELIAKLQQLGLEEEKVYNLAVQYTNALKRGGQEAASAISNQIVLSAQNFVAKQKELALTKQQIDLSSEQILTASAIANARRVSGETAVRTLTSIIAKEKELVAAMKQRGIDTSQTERQLIELLNAVTAATDKNTIAILENVAAKQNGAKSNELWEKSAVGAFESVSKWTSAVGGLTMGLGFLFDALAQTNEENKEFYESAGNATMQAGMFAMAIGSISSAIGSMIPMLIKGISWLNKFAAARSMAGLGLAGGVALGVGAIIKNAYEKFNQTGIASQLDEYGNEVSYDFGHSFATYGGNRDSHGNLKKGADFAVVSATKDNIGLNYTPGGGTSKGGGSGSKTNKAEEYAARMKKIIEDLNKEMTNMRGNATAYEKVMASAQDKLAGYEKEIVKAEQLGVDVGEVRKKQEDYLLAVKKKAVQAQEDENLKYMKLEEEQAQRINVLGQGTMDQQRAVYAERLEAHKAYLEELLAADIDNKERRMQLEQELANVQKQINDNAVYNFKSGWNLALDEIANRQTNWAEMTKSAFDQLESGMADVIVEGKKASDFLKNFFKSIIKSLVQVILKQLIANALMRALGGGGSVTIPSGTGALGSISDTWAAGGFVGYSGGKASGGNVSAGRTYLVGENGPELLRLGTQSGKVYSHHQTESMLDNKPVVNIEIVNNTDSQMKARQEESFSGGRWLKRVIIDTVNEAAFTNEGGMRDTIAGVRGV